MKKYQKDSNVVEVGSLFLYREEIYKRTPRYFGLWKTTMYASKKPLLKLISRGIFEDYTHDPQTHISFSRTLELIEAPEDYLIKNNYQLI